MTATTYCGHCGEPKADEGATRVVEEGATPVVEEGVLRLSRNHPATPVVEEGVLRLSRNHPKATTHASCARHLALEPPRFCASCRRRMKVQVTPAGWSAECVEHGLLRG